MKPLGRHSRVGILSQNALLGPTEVFRIRYICLADHHVIAILCINIVTDIENLYIMCATSYEH